MTESHKNPPKNPKDAEIHKAKTLDAAGWGLLLVWLGITTLFAFNWPVFLIGLGVLVLGMQAVRSSWRLQVEGFWIILGIVFIAAGVAESFGTSFPLVPAALILFGLATLYGVYRRLND